MGAAIQAYWQARNDARFDEAAAKREEARGLLSRVAVGAPQYGSWAQNVAQLYQNAGISAQARAIAQEALSRADGLGQSHPARILLLNMLADFWQEDRNLLKSLVYREKAAVALDAAPPAKTSAPGLPLATFRGSGLASSRLGPVRSPNYVYQQLADTYQRLGRREAASAALAKIRALASDNPAALASFYERQGQLDEAAALYRKEAEAPAADPKAEPWRLIGPLQSLASLYQRQERYGDAAAALQRAIDVLNASGRPEARQQTIWIRQRLAGILNQAGQNHAADQIYQQLLAETQDGRNGMYVQVLTSYANHLGMTKRGAQAEDLLNGHLANHPNLQPGEESNLLFSLASVARMSGQPKRADEYQRAARDKQQAAHTPPGRTFIGTDLERAQSAAGGDNLDEAFSLTLQAMDSASRAVDREQIAYAAPSIAATLAARNGPDKAEEIYQRLIGLVQSWSADTVQPLLNVLQSYERLLVQQRRWDEVPGAIERYRDALIRARGSGTGWLGEVLRLTIDAERARGSPERALRAAEDLLALEESLSGTTSEPYLHAVEMLAELYESDGDSGRGLPLRLQAITLADLALTANDARRGWVRINAALALARLRQFDEAERLATEAVAIGREMRPPQPNLFAQQREQIAQMKTAPSGVTRDVRWFIRRSLVVQPDGSPPRPPDR